MAACASCMPFLAHAGDVVEKNFTITAYYSPLPDQCCYVRGSFEADKVLNGAGIHGADGTNVYPGMIAAPASYPFGTRVELPGMESLQCMTEEERFWKVRMRIVSIFGWGAAKKDFPVRLLLVCDM